MDPTTPLEDAEALRILLDTVFVQEIQARHLLDLAGKLTHTVRRFAETVVDDRPADPAPLLVELGAALEIGAALERTQGGLAEALGSLSFALAPRVPRNPRIQARELETLRERLAVRSQARWRVARAG